MTFEQLLSVSKFKSIWLGSCIFKILLIHTSLLEVNGYSYGHVTVYKITFEKGTKMRRLWFTTFVSFLLSVILFTSGCSSSDTNKVQSVISCFGDVAVKVVVGVMSDTEPVTWTSLLTVIPGCINSAITIFSSPSSNPSSPEVSIHTASSHGFSQGSVYSNAISNCTVFYRTVTFNFVVPFEMVVGQSPDQSVFGASPPSGSSDHELVAQQLFQQYGDYINSILSPGPSQSVMLTIPPETQVRLRLPVQVSYKEGEAQVVHTDGSTVALPWLFTDGYQQVAPITSSSTAC